MSCDLERSCDPKSIFSKVDIFNFVGSKPTAHMVIKFAPVGSVSYGFRDNGQLTFPRSCDLVILVYQKAIFIHILHIFNRRVKNDMGVITVKFQSIFSKHVASINVIRISTIFKMAAKRPFLFIYWPFSIGL